MLNVLPYMVPVKRETQYLGPKVVRVSSWESRDKASRFQSFRVSEFQSFKVSRFQGFKVSKFYGLNTMRWRGRDLLARLGSRAGRGWWGLHRGEPQESVDEVGY